MTFTSPRGRIWTTAAGFVLVFALLSLLFDSPHSRLTAIAMAAVASIVTATIADVMLRRETGSEDSQPVTPSPSSSFDATRESERVSRRKRERGMTSVLKRIAAGRLDVTTDEISGISDSVEVSGSIRALVLRLERTLNRFNRLAHDVQSVSGSIVTSARSVSQGTEGQMASTAKAAQSINEIDHSINSVQVSMESLSRQAEETSTSILEMSASIEEVRRIADKLYEFVDETSSSINEMIASIDEVATNTETFSSFAAQTASSMVEMNATTEEIARSAKQSSNLASDVMGAAEDGREAVEGSVGGMRAIQSSVSDARDTLETLGKRSEEIGEIVRVIDEIARQTNLLALNAAIIAAQAGERGRGFAVVADEIRDLSERTSASTDEIRNLIKNVQQGISRAVETMSESSDRVEEGVLLTDQAERVLGRILELTTTSTESIQAIARATEEQIRGSKATTEAIEEVTKMVQNTATATQEQAQTSQQIGEKASTVIDYMKHLQRAMEEQEEGSRSIGQAMEKILEYVSSVSGSTKNLSEESASIVDNMSFVEEGARDTSFAISDLFRMANTLRHEANLLGQELQTFTLPQPKQGGSITSATVLPHKLSLDPVDCQFMALNYPQKAIHETLIQFGEGAEIGPGLAESWEILEQGRVYRFKLREGAKFHNGREITARDVEKSFLRVLDPEIKSLGSWIFEHVQGAPDVMAGKAQEAHGLRVLDDRTIEIHLSEPLGFFIQLMSMPETAIIPVDDITRESMLTSPIGAGPFKAESTEEGSHIRLVRHDGYYDSDKPYLDEVLLRLDLKSSSEMTDAFMKGELDVAHGIPPSIVAELRDDPEFSPYLLAATALHTSYIGYDTSTGPLKDLQARKAFSHAINKERINERVFSGMGVPASNLIPPGLAGHDPDAIGYPYDPEKSRALLSEAGLGSGFELNYWTFDTDEFNNSGIVDLIIEDLEAVGIRTKKQTVEREEARQRHSGSGHDSWFAGNWYADFPDADNFFFIFFHSSSRAIPGVNFHSEEIDAMIEQARATLDTDQREQVYEKLSRIVIEQVPLTYLFHDRIFVLHKPKVRAVRLHLAPPPVRYPEIWIES